MCNSSHVKCTELHNGKMMIQSSFKNSFHCAENQNVSILDYIESHLTADNYQIEGNNVMLDLFPLIKEADVYSKLYVGFVCYIFYQFIM